MPSGEIKIKTFEFTWEIQNFSKKGEKMGDPIFSPIFKIGDAQIETQWRLILYPYGKKVKDYLCILLQPISNKGWLKTYIYELHLLDNNGKKRYGLKSEVQYQSGLSGWTMDCRRSVLLKENSSFIVNDNLSIFCCITVNPYTIQEFEDQKILLNNNETLFPSTTLNDLSIIIGTKKIKVHKKILCCKSEVFYAMFKHDMKERNTSTIDIDDISYEVMIELVLFLYCGKVRSIKNLARPLLIAADKYDIISLKEICEGTIFEDLNVENACEVLDVADLYNCERLKSDTIDYIINNIKAVTSTPTFKELKNCNAGLLEDILFRMVQSNRISSMA